MADYPQTQQDVMQTVRRRLAGEPVGPEMYDQEWPGEWLYAGYSQSFSKVPALADAFWLGLVTAYETALRTQQPEANLAYANDLLSRLERSGVVNIPYPRFASLKSSLLDGIEREGIFSCPRYMAALLTHQANSNDAIDFWEQTCTWFKDQRTPLTAEAKTRLLYALNGLMRTGQYLQRNMQSQFRALRQLVLPLWPGYITAESGLHKELEIRNAIPSAKITSDRTPRERWATDCREAA